MPCLRAHCRQQLRDSTRSLPALSPAQTAACLTLIKQQILWRFSYFFSSRYVNKGLYTCYTGVTYLLCQIFVIIYIQNTVLEIGATRGLLFYRQNYIFTIYCYDKKKTLFYLFFDVVAQCLYGLCTSLLVCWSESTNQRTSEAVFLVIKRMALYQVDRYNYMDKQGPVIMLSRVFLFFKKKKKNLNRL